MQKITKSLSQTSKSCILKLSPESVGFIVTGNEAGAGSGGGGSGSGGGSGGTGGVQIWSQVKIKTLFDEYRIESRSNNEIYLELISLDALGKALRSAEAAGAGSTHNSHRSLETLTDAEVYVKLGKKNNKAVLIFEIKGNVSHRNSSPSSSLLFRCHLMWSLHMTSFIPNPKHTDVCDLTCSLTSPPATLLDSLHLARSLSLYFGRLFLTSESFSHRFDGSLCCWPSLSLLTHSFSHHLVRCLPIRSPQSHTGFPLEITHDVSCVVLSPGRVQDLKEPMCPPPDVGRPPPPSFFLAFFPLLFSD